MHSHPTRTELIAAARGGTAVAGEHLSSCDWCSLYFELYSEFSFAGELALVSAPRSWIDKAMAVAVNSSERSPLKSLFARLSFDSWATAVPQGVRSAGAMEERRVTFDAVGKTLDIRAEHRQNLWEFTAKITDKSGNPAGWILVVGSEKITANEDGFYQWSSVRPPKKFKLLSHDGEFETSELLWKKSRPQ